MAVAMSNAVTKRGSGIKRVFQSWLRAMGDIIPNEHPTKCDRPLQRLSG
ncbi:MAG: hypothetical protein FAZ92_01885 [Accumulibacter sp.]|nr:MAG: hypothetical protein FAZ92_01885 [Accumulibacter sp.]